MAAWDTGTARTRDLDDFKAWSRELTKLHWHRGEHEVFTDLGTVDPVDATPGKVEVRSAYIVGMTEIARVRTMLLDA